VRARTCVYSAILFNCMSSAAQVTNGCDDTVTVRPQSESIASNKRLLNLVGGHASVY